MTQPMNTNEGGAKIGTIIIIIVLLVGGVYFFQNQAQTQAEREAQLQASLFSTTSDEASAIQSDADSLDFSDLDADLQ